MKNKVKQLTLLNFPEQINVPTVILFSREGCHYCNKLKPIYEKISNAKKYQGIYNFYAVDADEEEILYDKFKADGVPTMFVLYEDSAIEIPYPSNPDSGYDKESIVSFLDELME